jgi:AI-2 transport protein TqsA
MLNMFGVKSPRDGGNKASPRYSFGGSSKDDDEYDYEQQQRESLASAEKVRTMCLLLIAIILSSAALYWLQRVLVPLVLAVMMSYTLAPLVDFCTHRAKVPHGASVTITLFFGLGILFSLLFLISHSVKDLVQDAKKYERYVVRLTNRAGETLSRKNIDMDVIEAQLQDIPLAKMVAQSTHAMLQAVLDLLSNVVLVLIFVVYLLEGRRRQKAERRVPGGVWTRIETRIKRYILLKFFVSTLNGFIAASIYYMLNVELAMVFGVLHFVMNFIPHVGPIIATVLPLPVVLVSNEIHLFHVMMVIILPGVTHFFIGNVIEPKLMGGHLDLHPITVLLCLIFWTMLWGIPGAVLAAPMTASLKILCESVEVVQDTVDGFQALKEVATTGGGVPTMKHARH